MALHRSAGRISIGSPPTRPEDVAKSTYLDALQKQSGPLEENRLYSIASDTSSAGIDILPSEDAILFLLGPEYAVTIHSPSRSTGRGPLALLPGRAPGTHILPVASSLNPTVASVLTIPGEWEQAHFEAIIRYERNRDGILDAQPVAIYRTLP